MTPKKAYAISKRHKAKLFIWHTRTRTHGSISQDMCHPFRILNKASDGCDLFFMHNGTFSRSMYTRGTESDTVAFNNLILKPVLKANTKALNDTKFIDLIDGLMGYGNKVVFLRNDGIMHTFGAFTRRDGCSISNTYSVTDVRDYTPERAALAEKRWDKLRARAKAREALVNKRKDDYIKSHPDISSAHRPKNQSDIPRLPLNNGVDHIQRKKQVMKSEEEYQDILAQGNLFSLDVNDVVYNHLNIFKQTSMSFSAEWIRGNYQDMVDKITSVKECKEWLDRSYRHEIMAWLYIMYYGMEDEDYYYLKCISYDGRITPLWLAKCMWDSLVYNVELKKELKKTELDPVVVVH